jgi:hypothetical protein
LDLSKIGEGENSGAARARFVLRTLCDGEGNPTFADDELDSVLNIPFCATLSIYNQGMKLNYPELEESEDGEEKN